MLRKKTIEDIDLKNKCVLLRVDFNVPLDDNLVITDDSRIVKALDTIRYCIKQGSKLVIMSHLGRPKSKKDTQFSLKPAVAHLTKLLNQKVELLDDCIGPSVQNRVAAMKSGEVIMLENVRFYPEEEKNDPAFAKQLASLGEVYVNDAFGTAHRAHASTEGVAKYLPAVAGYLLGREIMYFDKALQNPERPFITILGGAKVSDKIQLIANLLDKADKIIIGGAMAYTFYKVMGIAIGDSKFDPAGVDVAKDALAKSKAKGVPMIFPVDRVVAQKLEKNAPHQVVNGDIPDHWSGFDIGPTSVQLFKNELCKAKTIVWNGPLGVCEYPPFDQGTRQIAHFLAELKSVTTIIGGGDTAAAVKQFGLEEKMSHVSTGGGASLEYLEGTNLPGIDALMDKDKVNI